VEASLDFAIGREAYRNHQIYVARQHYQDSLAYWRKCGDRLRQGVLLFYLGNWWLNYALSDRRQKDQGLATASNYLQQCIDVFVQADRRDIAAKYINVLGLVLYQQQLWHDLEQVAKTAIAMHLQLCKANKTNETTKTTTSNQPELFSNHPSHQLSDQSSKPDSHLATARWSHEFNHLALSDSVQDTASTSAQPAASKKNQVANISSPSNHNNRIAQLSEPEISTVLSQIVNQNHQDSDHQAQQTGIYVQTRLAHAYSFLAEIALHRQNWQEAKHYAQLALQIHQQAIAEPTNSSSGSASSSDASIASTKPIAWHDQHAQYDQSLATYAQQLYCTYAGQYQLLLAKAHLQLNQPQLAEVNLKQAQHNVDAQQHPQLYIEILAALRQIYYDRGKFIEAFRTKQEQQAIQQQYGWLAFIGAGRLQARKQPHNLTISSQTIKPVEMAAEIKASGRSQDVVRLKERISHSDYKLTVLHGVSGVGKSSLVNAGLVPAFQAPQATNGKYANAQSGQSVLPIVISVYSNWIDLIWQAAIAVTQQFNFGVVSAANFNATDLKSEDGNQDDRALNSQSSIQNDLTIETLLQQIHRLSDRQVLTVIIFDQFEEFFFTCRNGDDRQQFFQFLQACMDIPFVRLVLSIREDYLHLLLEFELFCLSRLGYGQDNNNTLTSLSNIPDVLSRHWRYQIGNLSPDDARSVINSLTEQAQWQFEPALIDALVADLAADLGSVRPIELQVVGAQLQAENITTLAKYQQFGPAKKLVERSLAQLIKDCGANAELAAQQVLLSLTDEHDTRPIKTYVELANALGKDADKLDLILEILVGSGLVFQLPEVTTRRYQLVHDYLVAFIRQQQESGLIAELIEMRRKAAINQARINRLIKAALIGAVAALAAISGLAWQAESQRKLAEVREIKAIAASSDALLLLDNQLEAMITAVRAGRKLKHSAQAQADPQVNRATLAALQAATHEMQELNRFESKQAPIYAARFSPDGTMIAAASWDHGIKIWHRNGEQVKI
jgi:hypothetical protein